MLTNEQGCHQFNVALKSLLCLCVVPCIFTLFMSQLQDMNMCPVGFGLLQGSSTSWPTHSVSPDPCNPLLSVFSSPRLFKRHKGEFF